MIEALEKREMFTVVAPMILTGAGTYNVAYNGSHYTVTGSAGTNISMGGMGSWNPWRWRSSVVVAS